jgi:transposase-like protein
MNIEKQLKQHIQNKVFSKISRADARDIISQVELIERAENVSQEFKSWLQGIKLKAMFRLNDLI